MKSYQNRLERFRAIAKKLVDDHSAELFNKDQFSSGIGHDVYMAHLDTLGKQLDEQAKAFIGSAHVSNDSFRSEVWNTCRKYLEQFVKRNQEVF